MICVKYISNSKDFFTVTYGKGESGAHELTSIGQTYAQILPFEENVLPMSFIA